MALSTAENETDWGVEPDVRLDLTDLAPPEPMVRILVTLGGLPSGGTVLARLRRRPIFLYPRLLAMGCTHETRELGPGAVEILVRKPGRRA
jgi:hypothetical protein